MKPKEFDELVRQKFDQNDFAYNSRNWDDLAEQMDGRAKKRSMLMWWLMPMAGIAASVALAMGVTGLLRQPGTTTLPGANTAAVHTSSPEKLLTIQNEPVTTLFANSLSYPKATNNLHTPVQKKQRAEINETFAISFENAVGFTPAHRNTKGTGFFKELIPKRNKPALAANEGYNTFMPEEEVKKEPKVSVILSAGISHGSQNSGYMAGATIRKMLSDKLFIESDVALNSSNNSQTTEVFVPDGGSAARHSAAKGTSVENITAMATAAGPQGSVKNENQSYNLYYAQVSPGIGYKLIKRMSVGIGPDFQQMLVDNRPAPSSVDRNNIAVAPVFDIGLIGKTELALTKKVKAGVYYRKGINNVLTPMDKYIDRDYLQFQLKCTIFNK